jgi:hypothetical protein
MRNNGRIGHSEMKPLHLIQVCFESMKSSLTSRVQFNFQEQSSLMRSLMNIYTKISLAPLTFHLTDRPPDHYAVHPDVLPIITLAIHPCCCGCSSKDCDRREPGTTLSEG